MMLRNLSVSLVMCGALSALLVAIPAHAQNLYVSPDVATSPDGVITALPWQIVRHDGGSYALTGNVPSHVSIDGLHKLDAPNAWLLSVDAAADLGSGIDVFPEDVVRLEAGGPTPFFDGSCVTPPIPSGSNVDALTLLGGDDSNLFLSLDVRSELAGTSVPPSGVVEYERTGPGPCDWSFLFLNLDLAGFVSTLYAPLSARITGLDASTERLLVSFDIPVDLGPTGESVPFLPGQIVALDLSLGGFSTFEDLRFTAAPGWPVSSGVDALSCEANPGRMNGPASITLTRSGGDVLISCVGSCSSGGVVSGIYEGTLASLRAGAYDHGPVDCSATCAGNNLVTPASQSTYYLVVPGNGKEEGSYGLDSAAAERPAAVQGCAAVQKLTACP